ncbi:hypothetical protein [Synoicihabitans lomoniglobus]|uniref:Uncharacterized protein n=1 Tax=Synoicihabitans lomoniglobus TaxID=2909285 RepID=A0AAF0CRV2_9BACT|nr:hypothetical protein [Opitutaceae bacterium LMO-M01]WED66939.1 hypothetical protein PXH66_08765 [Opitutaceae bacterium LMO-M01]
MTHPFASVFVVSRGRVSLLLLIVIGMCARLGASVVEEKVILAPVFTLDQIHRSMMGPSAMQQFILSETEEPELLWLVSYRAEMVNADGSALLPQEYMCHSNLDIDISAYRELFAWEKVASPRLFTLSQGQFEVNFPEGFGIPLVSWQPLTLNSQVLNLNDPDIDLKVRHRITIKFVRDRNLTTPMTPLFMSAAQAMVLVEGQSGYWGLDRADVATHGAACAIGTSASHAANTDQFGNQFSAHWVVPPGEHTYHALATNWLNLPFDTTAHYVAVHLHPFAEYIELVDLTEGRTVFRSEAKNRTTGIGLEAVEFYADANGFALHEAHEYQVKTLYNNTTEVDQDSMAVMYFYLKDQEFRKPTPAQIARRLRTDPLLRAQKWSQGPVKDTTVMGSGHSTM